MKENAINLNKIDLNNQTALSILTAASKAIAYEEVILSILVDTFISKISFPMQPGPEIGSISDA